jgi:hypothetical protein
MVLLAEAVALGSLPSYSMHTLHSFYSDSRNVGLTSILRHSVSKRLAAAALLGVGRQLAHFEC